LTTALATIVASAVRLLGAYSGNLTRVAGDQIVLAALTSADHAGDAALRAAFPRSLHFVGHRSLVAVPLLRHDEAVGTIAVTRPEAGGFTDDDIALLQTFADQAVIAIENAHLLAELQERTRELTRRARRSARTRPSPPCSGPQPPPGRRSRRADGAACPTSCARR
jgi:GAF domain-containing protein